MKRNKGITLITLVITIILLIILAGIMINIGIKENGIFSQAKYAKEETNKQTATEKINLKITTAQMNSYAQKEKMPTLKELSMVLKEDNEIEYVTEKSQIASTKYEVGENPTSIFTKLKDYKYEFEIDSSFRLASINGIKIAKSEMNNIDYSNSKNEIILTKNAQVDSKINNWGGIDIEGPEIEAGTWLIFINIMSNGDTSGHQTVISGTGCFSNAVPANTWAGVNHISGYYKGEKTKLKAQVYNGSEQKREYTFTFKALKLSDTY